MGEQLTTSAEALRLFFTDDIYLISGDEQINAAALPELKIIPLNEAMAIAQPVVKTEEPEVEAAVNPEESISAAVEKKQEESGVLQSSVPAVPVLTAEESPVLSGSVPELPVTAEEKADPSTAAVSVIPVIPEEKTNQVVFKYLGKNQKNILILVRDQQHDVSTERGRELLRNIVKAIQLSANDFALLNYAAYTDTKYEHLNQFFASKLVMSFGISSAELGLSVLAQNTLHMHGNTQLVFSANLDELAEDMNGKKTLWGSLKKLTI